MFSPAVFIGQKTNVVFNSSLDFNIKVDYSNQTYFSNSIYYNPFFIIQIPLLLENHRLIHPLDRSIFDLDVQQKIGLLNYENSIPYGAGNNVFYRELFLNKGGMDNLAVNLFLGLIIEVCRVIETPQITFCP